MESEVSYLTKTPKEIYIGNCDVKVSDSTISKPYNLRESSLLYNESAKPTFGHLHGYWREVSSDLQLKPMRIHHEELDYSGRISPSRVLHAIMEDFIDYLQRERSEMIVRVNEDLRQVNLYSTADPKPLEVTISVHVVASKCKTCDGKKRNSTKQLVFEMKDVRGNERQYHILGMLSDRLHHVSKMDDEIFTRVFIASPIWKMLREPARAPLQHEELHRKAEPNGLMAHGK